MSPVNYSRKFQCLLLFVGCCIFLNPSFGQSPALQKGFYTFPQEGVPNNNGYIGDFCCTGRTATVRLKSGTPIGYIYFFNWQGPAYNAKTDAIIGTLELLVSGGTLGDPDTRIKSSIVFSSEDIRNRNKKTAQVGDLRYVAYISAAKAAPERKGYWYMGSFQVQVDIKLNASSAPVVVDEVKQAPEPNLRVRPTPQPVQRPPVNPNVRVQPQQKAQPVQKVPMVTHLDILIRTGGDDLRGGNDNAFVTVVADNDVLGKAADDVKSSQIPLVDRAPLNRGARWHGNSNNRQKIRLPRPIALENLRSVSIITNFGGGIGGDNWNVDRLQIIAVGADGFRKELYHRSGSPLVRFTGERKVFRARW